MAGFSAVFYVVPAGSHQKVGLPDFPKEKGKIEKKEKKNVLKSRNPLKTATGHERNYQTLCTVRYHTTCDISQRSKKVLSQWRNLYNSMIRTETY